jgi:hypothetical protein
MNELMIAANTSLVNIRMDAQSYPRLHTYSQQEGIMQMTKMVFLAAAYRGYNVDKEQISFIATNLYRDLMEDEERLGTHNITFAEIGRIFKKAELYGLSVKGLYDAIIAYLKDEGHKAHKEAMRIQAEKHKAEEDAKMKAIIEKYAAMMEQANHDKKV